MKIAHVTYGLGMGGIETMLVNISREQATSGHQVHLVVLNDIVEESLAGRIGEGVSLHLLGRPCGSYNPVYIIRMNRLLRSLSPDVVHLHYSSLSRYLFYRGLKRRMCVTLHEMYRPEVVKRLDRSGPVFAISDMVREDIASKLGLEATTVYNGIYPEQLKRRLSDRKPSEPFSIVEVGRLFHPEKGQDILIRAVAALVGRGRNVRLTLIGEGNSRVFLESLIAELGLGERVELMGNMPQSYVLSHIADYDLFVQPSRLEGFGLTVAEAMAAGVPVLVSDNNAPVEVVGHGKYGYLFHGEDPTDCARRIEEIMDSYPDSSFLARAYERVNTLYNVRNTASRYVELYEKLVISRQR